MPSRYWPTTVLPMSANLRSSKIRKSAQGIRKHIAWWCVCGDVLQPVSSCAQASWCLNVGRHCKLAYAKILLQFAAAARQRCLTASRTVAAAVRDDAASAAAKATLQQLCILLCAEQQPLRRCHLLDGVSRGLGRLSLSAPCFSDSACSWRTKSSSNSLSRSTCVFSTQMCGPTCDQHWHIPQRCVAYPIRSTACAEVGSGIAQGCSVAFDPGVARHHFTAAYDAAASRASPFPKQAYTLSNLHLSAWEQEVQRNR